MDGSELEALRAKIALLEARLKRREARKELSLPDVTYLGETVSGEAIRERIKVIDAQVKAKAARKAVKPAQEGAGRYQPMGGNLYKGRTGPGGESWFFRQTGDWYGLGSCKEVDLITARGRVMCCQKIPKEEGIKARRKALEEEAVAQKVAGKTFREAAEAKILAAKAGWKISERRAAKGRGPKQADDWAAALKTYVYPTMGDLPVKDVTTDHIRDVLMQTVKGGESFWNTHPDVANKTRLWMKAILAFAKSKKWREGDNPAEWENFADELTPPKEVKPPEHHPALHYDDMPRFTKFLRAKGGFSALCMEFAILTSCRTGDAIGARWSEINLDKGLWTIPAARLKGKKGKRRTDHVIPLSDRAIEILVEMQAVRGLGGEHVFPGGKAGQPLSSNALIELMKDCRGQRPDPDDDYRFPSELTVHGFRATFRTWAGETTAYPRDMLEIALAHTQSSATEEAYMRGPMIEKRRRLMRDWAEHCETAPVRSDNVRKIGEGRDR